MARNGHFTPSLQWVAEENDVDDLRLENATDNIFQVLRGDDHLECLKEFSMDTDLMAPECTLLSGPQHDRHPSVPPLRDCGSKVSPSTRTTSCGRSFSTGRHLACLAAHTLPNTVDSVTKRSTTVAKASTHPN